MKQDITCCVTGHRPERLPWGREESDQRCCQLKRDIADVLILLYHLGYRHFICGMALGVDTYFAELVLALRERYEDVTLEVAIPCEEQCRGWTVVEQQRYRAIIEQSNFETMVQQHYSRGCMHRRNRYMVDHAGLLLAVHDGKGTGGSAQTLRYAEKQGLKVMTCAIPN